MNVQERQAADEKIADLAASILLLFASIAGASQRQSRLRLCGSGWILGGL